MTDNRKAVDPAETASGDKQPVMISRRSLLKQGSMAMPAVLTLPSGAALAASSVYIGTNISREGASYAGGVLCLDTSTADEVLPNGSTYKYVTTTYADIYHIQDGEYFPEANKSGVPISADEFCRTGGIRYLDAKKDDVAIMPEKVGALVSMTAINSITAALDVLPLKNLP